MKVVLTRKLADCVDGIDITAYRVGDVLDLPAVEAHTLMAEAWAMPDRRREPATPPSSERRKPPGPERNIVDNHLQRVF